MKPTTETIIFVLADGARHDVLKSQIDQKVLNHFPGDLYKGTTCFPSVTGPAYLPFISGELPGTANIPGIRWFDRAEYAKWWKPSRFKYRSYCGLGGIFFKEDLHSEAVTLFEHDSRNVNVYNHFYRGVPSKNYLMKYSRLSQHVSSYLTGEWLKGDQEIGRKFFKWLEKNHTQLPPFIFIAFKSIDEMSHHHSATSPQTLMAYKILDEFFAEAKRKFEQYNLSSRIQWVVSSDHGHTDTHTHLDLVKIVKSQGYRPLYHPLIGKPFTDSAVMVSGNSMAHIYLKNQFQGWKIRTSWEYIMHSHEKLMNRLLSEEGIDFLVSRSANGRIYVTSRKGTTWFRVSPHGMVDYQIVKGEDPLQLNLEPMKNHIDETLPLTLRTHYPDSILQLSQIFRSPRTGDLLVNARPGFDLRDEWESPEHFSSHGSLHKEHMIVPVLSTLPLRSPVVRTVDLYASICDHLKYPVPERCDGTNQFIAFNDSPSISKDTSPKPMVEYFL